MSPRPLEPSANFSLELTGDHGAALLTRYPTFWEDSLERSAFVKYTKCHYKSWVKFACDKQYGDNIQPILVSGFDITKGFEMVAYAHEGTSPDTGLIVDIPALGSVCVPPCGMWRTRCLPHMNHGPRTTYPMGSLPSGYAETGGILDEFNQCVFIRYCTMRSRKPIGMFPEVIWVGAGPHNLGSGENRGGTFSELAVQVDEELIADDEEDPGTRLAAVIDDAGAETDVVA